MRLIYFFPFLPLSFIFPKFGHLFSMIGSSAGLSSSAVLLHKVAAALVRDHGLVMSDEGSSQRPPDGRGGRD